VSNHQCSNSARPIGSIGTRLKRIRPSTNHPVGALGDGYRHRQRPPNSVTSPANTGIGDYHGLQEFNASTVLGNLGPQLRAKESTSRVEKCECGSLQEPIITDQPHVVYESTLCGAIFPDILGEGRCYQAARAFSSSSALQA